MSSTCSHPYKGLRWLQKYIILLISVQSPTAERVELDPEILARRWCGRKMNQLASRFRLLGCGQCCSSTQSLDSSRRSSQSRRWLLNLQLNLNEWLFRIIHQHSATVLNITSARPPDLSNVVMTRRRAESLHAHTQLVLERCTHRALCVSLWDGFSKDPS